MPAHKNAWGTLSDRHSSAFSCRSLLKEISGVSRARVEELWSSVAEEIEASRIDYIRTDTRLSIAIRGADGAQERLRQVLPRLRSLQEPLIEANNAVVRLEKEIATLKEACWIHHQLTDVQSLLGQVDHDFFIEDVMQRCRLLQSARELLEPLTPLSRRGCPLLLSSCLETFESLTVATIEGMVRAVTEGPLLTIAHMHLASQSLSPGLWIGARALDVEVEILDVLAECLITNVINPIAIHRGDLRLSYAGFAKDWSLELLDSGELDDAAVGEALETMVEFLKRTVFPEAMGHRLWPVMGNCLLDMVAVTTFDRLKAHMRSIGFIDEHFVPVSCPAHPSTNSAIADCSIARPCLVTFAAASTASAQPDL